MYKYSLSFFSLNELYLLGGTYKSIRVVEQSRKIRVEEGELCLGGKTYIGIIRFNKYKARIVDILDDGTGEDCLEDFLQTWENIKKEIPREVFYKKLGVYSTLEDIIIAMRIALLISFGIFCYRGFFQPHLMIEYVLGVFLIIIVFLLSSPLLIDSMRRM